MTVRDFLEYASEAVRQIQEITLRAEARRALIGVHGSSGEAISRGTTLDPMRQVDEAIDSEADEIPLLRRLETEVRDAWAACLGIEVLSSHEAGEVCRLRYLSLNGWREVSERLRHPEGECQALLDSTLEWADGIGVARLVSYGSGIMGLPSENSAYHDPRPLIEIARQK